MNRPSSRTPFTSAGPATLQAGPVAWPAALAGAEGQFRIPLAVTDREMIVQWVNEDAAQVFDVPAAALVGRSWYELVPQAEGRRALHEQLLAGAIDDFELDDQPVQIGTGPVRHFAFRIRAARDRDGVARFLFGVAADVSSRVRAESALRTSEERYRALATHSRDLILIVAADGTIQYSSPALEQALGYAVSERVGRSVFEFVHPEDAARIAGRFGELAGRPDAGEIAQAEFRVRRRNGEWLWIHMVGVNLLEHPAVRGVVLTGRNITLRKQAEVSLAAERTRLDTVLVGAQIGTWCFDLATDRLELDENCSVLAGVDLREPVARADWLAAVHRDEQPAVRDWFDRTAAAGGAWDEVEYRHMIPGRQTRWVLVRGHALPGSDGRAARLVGIVIDVGSRRATEEALRASEARYRSLARLFGGYVYEGRLLADGEIEVVWASQKFEDVYGCGVAEFNRRGWRAFVHPLEWAGFNERAARLRRGETSVAELRILRANGEPRWLRVAVEPVYEAATVVGLIGMGEDITERKVLEEQVLAAANREQQRIGNDLHDGLGQLLTGIGLLLGGHANSLRRGRRIAAADLDAVTRHVNTAIESARALARGLSPVALDAGGIVFALDELARTAGALYGIEVGFEHSLDAPLALDATRSDHLYRIAQEALSNAGRHASARRIDIRLTADVSQVRLTVRDDGVGITPRTDGTGMGMRIMAYRARTIGGVLVVQPAAGGGTAVECIARQDARDAPAGADGAPSDAA